MKKSIFILCCLVISHLAVYHYTKFTTEQRIITNYKKNLLDILFIIDDPTIKNSDQAFGVTTFSKMLRNGWDITESDKSYSLIFNNQHEWKISKDDLNTIKRIDPE
jgi:hypothetical protein